MERLRQINQKLSEEKIALMNELADKNCVYCLLGMTKETQYNKKKAPVGARLVCNHDNFHRDCVVPDLLKNKRCPVCR